MTASAVSQDNPANPLQHVHTVEQEQAQRLQKEERILEEMERKEVARFEESRKTGEERERAAAKEELQAFRNQELPAILEAERAATEASCAQLRQAAEKNTPAILARLQPTLLDGSFLSAV